MADVRFYHMELQSLEQILPMLLNKALQGGHKIIVRAPNDAAVEQLNAHLWAYDSASFLPHGSAKDGNAEAQPIWITAGDDNPNEAGVLILTQGATCEDVSGFAMVCEMLNGRDEQAVAGARARWKVYKEADHEVTYWQQSSAGKWDKKA
jgi:DNA polymerase-3 subunit chi